MLEVLRFKKSLFAGVLDGGDKDVFMGGSRLNKFMETVEAATAAIPEAMLEDAEEALRMPQEAAAEPAAREEDRPRRLRRGRRSAMAARQRDLARAALGAAEADEDAVASSAATTPAADPWAALLQAGMSFFQQFTPAPRNGSSADHQVESGPPDLVQSLVKRDEQTGETYLKLPVPAPDLLDRALRAVGSLLESLRR